MVFTILLLFGDEYYGKKFDTYMCEVGVTTPWGMGAANKYYIQGELEGWERDIILDALENYIFKLKCVDTEHIKELDERIKGLIERSEDLVNRFTKMEFNK